MTARARARMLRWVAVATMGSLAACQSLPRSASIPSKALIKGGVSGSEVAPEASSRMTLKSNQAFVRGDLIEPSEVPVYPAESLAAQLPPQVLCVQFVVGRDGAVSNIVPLTRDPECPAAGAEQAPFVGAVVAAVSQWEFYSNQVCTFPPGTPAERRCSGPGVRVEPVAVTLIYRFEFSQRDGAGVVERSMR